MSDRSDAADAPNLGDFRDRLFHRSVPLPACVGPGDSAGVCSAQVHTRTSPVPRLRVRCPPRAHLRPPPLQKLHPRLARPVRSPYISTPRSVDPHRACSPPLRAGHAEHPPRWALLPSEDAPGAPVEAPRAAPAEAPANPRGAVLARLRVPPATAQPSLPKSPPSQTHPPPPLPSTYATPRFTPSARRPPPRTPPRPIRTPRPLPPAHDSHVPPPVLRVALGSAPLRAMGRPLHAARRIPAAEGYDGMRTWRRPPFIGSRIAHRQSRNLRLTSPSPVNQQSPAGPPADAVSDRRYPFSKKKTGPRLAEGDCDEFLASDLLETEP
ncbi:hypothetical protein B0H15DRAFT_978115 [Mycena belliarum]|uniref:Uncharacterized protein n=1 Tax=Mycena belliarum TaxID=1033014 RepID=A0AAD6XHC8_9AGAR|nr:hypothetical protein B0H15DRAFT_978115 [Mycena belliae]